VKIAGFIFSFSLLLLGTLFSQDTPAGHPDSVSPAVALSAEASHLSPAQADHFPYY
jgi:hypothetical protein